ncbi:MAG: hypothetical protein M3410_02510 [Acidobacteriota bacterium]|nr:hypothetical protein [Acidobacteriota bacterium]
MSAIRDIVSTRSSWFPARSATPQSFAGARGGFFETMPEKESRCQRVKRRRLKFQRMLGPPNGSALVAAS